MQRTKGNAGHETKCTPLSFLDLFHSVCIVIHATLNSTMRIFSRFLQSVLPIWATSSEKEKFFFPIGVKERGSLIGTEFFETRWIGGQFFFVLGSFPLCSKFAAAIFAWCVRPTFLLFIISRQYFVTRNCMLSVVIVLNGRAIIKTEVCGALYCFCKLRLAGWGFVELRENFPRNLIWYLIDVPPLWRPFDLSQEDTSKLVRASAFLPRVKINNNLSTHTKENHNSGWKARLLDHISLFCRLELDLVPTRGVNINVTLSHSARRDTQ